MKCHLGSVNPWRFDRGGKHWVRQVFRRCQVLGRVPDWSQGWLLFWSFSWLISLDIKTMGKLVDIMFSTWLDYKGILWQVFEPWMKNSEVRKQEGLRKPVSLVEACEILGDSKNLQDNAEAKLKVCSDSANCTHCNFYIKGAGRCCCLRPEDDQSPGGGWEGINLDPSLIFWDSRISLNQE